MFLVNKVKPLLTTVIIIISILMATNPVTAEIKEYSYEVINTYPHDIEAFTQGLTFHEGYLYEGTGRRKESSLRQVELKTGKIKKIHHLNDKYFGEGITILDNKIYQLTWQAEKGFIYDMEFEQIDEFNYKGEGWGLTDDGKHLIMSDGSSKLYFLNPESLEIVKKINVTQNQKPVKNINELEYIDGKIWANIWREDHIIIIDPKTGKITGRLNLENLIDPTKYDHNLDVLNGIAHDKENDRIFVTGKLWPLIFEIEVND